MNKKGLLTTALVSTTLLSGLISPTTLVMASPIISTNTVGAETAPNTKKQLGETIYDQVINSTIFDQSEGLLVLELTHKLTDYEAIVIHEDTPTGNSIGHGTTGNKQIKIDYKKIKNGHDYYIQYVNGKTGFNQTEIIQDTKFTDYVNHKEFIKLNTVTSDDTQVTGQTLPGGQIAISVLSDDEYTYETTADTNGHFEITIDKVLPGREILVKATGKYDTLTQNTFVQVGQEPVNNWFYNPDFTNNAKGWFTWGSDATITPKEEYTNFVNEDAGDIGPMGAIQNVEAKYGSLYTISMDIRVNKFNSEAFQEVYLGDVIPGGGLNPSFSSTTKLEKESEGKWQTVTFSQPYFGMPQTTYLGFTIWGVKDMDIKNVNYTRIDR